MDNISGVTRKMTLLLPSTGIYFIIGESDYVYSGSIFR